MAQLSLQEIVRDCCVCGSKLHITLRQSTHITGGHYFGRVNVPVKGTGEHVPKGTARIAGRTIKVVDWTGDYTSVEMWECDRCYHDSDKEDWLARKIDELFGPRCGEYEPGCPCCQAWEVYDEICDTEEGYAVIGRIVLPD